MRWSQLHGDMQGRWVCKDHRPLETYTSSKVLAKFLVG